MAPRCPRALRRRARRRRTSRSSRSSGPTKAKLFPYINLNNPSPNLLGQTVLALGNPLGYNSSVSRGILSANDREINVDRNVSTST